MRGVPWYLVGPWPGWFVGAPWAKRRRIVGVQPEVTAVMRGVGVPGASGSAPWERRRAMVGVDVGGVLRNSVVSPLGDEVVVLEVLPIWRPYLDVMVVLVRGGGGDVLGSGSRNGLGLPARSKWP
jgi:hypothetical protein